MVNNMNTGTADMLALMPLDLFVQYIVFPLLPAVHILKILSKTIKKKIEDGLKKFNAEYERLLNHKDFDKIERELCELYLKSSRNTLNNFLPWSRLIKIKEDEYTCMKAAGSGHLETLKQLRAQSPPCPWDENTCAWAAEKGHLEILKWLRAQTPSCPWDEFTCALAAKNGHLETLKWLRAQTPPCPWGEFTCALAAKNGHLEILKWLRAQKPPCPWDLNQCKRIAKSADVIEWLNGQ
jgi:hypothetical protein